MTVLSVFFTELSHLPEELVKVPMFHIFKHHDERVALHTHPVEGDDVFVLQVGEELRLSVEVRSAALVGFFQGLMKRQRRQSHCKERDLQEGTSSQQISAHWLSSCSLPWLPHGVSPGPVSGCSTQPETLSQRLPRPAPVSAQCCVSWCAGQL